MKMPDFKDFVSSIPPEKIEKISTGISNKILSEKKTCVH